MSNAEQKSVMTYSKVGGNYQLAVRTFEDLQAVMALDEAKKANSSLYWILYKIVNG